MQQVGVYNLTLQVADMSGEGLSSTASAMIYIDDINDNPPVFTEEEVRGGGELQWGWRWWGVVGLLGKSLYLLLSISIALSSLQST